MANTGVGGSSDRKSELERKHPVKYYWLTAGAAAVVCAIITVSVTNSGSSGSGSGSTSGSNPVAQAAVDDVPTAFQGTWEGELSFPDTPTAAVELELHSGTVGQSVGQFFNSTADCTANVILSSTGATLTLNLVITSNPAGVCVSQAVAEVQLEGGGLGFGFTTAGGAAPESGVLTQG